MSPVVLRYGHIFHGPSCIYLLLAALAHVLVTLYYGIGLHFKKEYLYPLLDVEILENSWYFLFKSSLIDKIGRIDKPESRSQNDLFAKVDALKLECFFGRPGKDNPYSEARVDVASVLEDPPCQKQQRKHSPRTPIFVQIPDTSSSSDSESSDDVSPVPHARGAMRRHSTGRELRSPNGDVGFESSGGGQDAVPLSEVEILDSEDTASDANRPRTSFWSDPVIPTTSFRLAGHGLLNRRQAPITYLMRRYHSFMAALRALPAPLTSLPFERHQPDDESVLELLQNLPSLRDLPESGEPALRLQNRLAWDGDTQSDTGNRSNNSFTRADDTDSETDRLLIEEEIPLEIGPNYPDDPLGDGAESQPVGSLQTYLPLFMIDEVADNSMEEDGV